MPAKDPERVRRGLMGAYAVHARFDVRETTRAAREAFFKKFELEVDPTLSLDPAERFRRAEALRRLHFLRMAERSAAVRAAKRTRSSGGIAHE